MDKSFDVLIIGGGIVGLTTAVAMAKRNFSVAVVDASSLAPSANQRVYAINEASKQLWEELGIWSFIDTCGMASYEHMHIWDAKNKGHIDFDSRLIARPTLGTIIEEKVIKEALLKQVDHEKNISLYPSTNIREVNSTEPLVIAKSANQSFSARLLFVADGKDSPIRQFLKVPLTTWPYHQHAVVATVTTEKAHQNTAYQVFNPDGPLAFLPLAHPNQCSIVWSTTPTNAAQLIALPDDSFNQQLGEAFAWKLAKVSVQSKRHQFPLVMCHAQQYVGKNWLLLGDAAHTIHPLAGLGLNVGLADIASWLKCLDKRSLTSATALAAYQRQRKYAVWQVIALMSALKNLFANPLPPVVALRGWGLNVCNHLSPLKRLFIEHAAGNIRQPQVV